MDRIEKKQDFQKNHSLWAHLKGNVIDSVTVLRLLLSNPPLNKKNLLLFKLKAYMNDNNIL